MNKFQEMYLDYVNNFLSVEKFAEYYRLTVEQAHYVIDSGRKCQESEVA
jgi:hypothetical protein